MHSNSMFQGAFRRLVSRFVLPGCLFVCASPSGLFAQTVVYTRTSTLGSGFNRPIGVAVDGSGNVYVADFDNSAVKEMVAVGGSLPALPTTRTLGSGFNGPVGVAVDSSGNVYVGDTLNNAVKEMLAVDGSIPVSPTINTLGSGFSDPEGVAVDGSGNVYVADTGNSAVKEMLSVGGRVPASPTIRTLGSGFSSPTGVAVDGSGNVYVADYGNNAVKEILAVGGSIPASPTIRALGSGFNSPEGVAVDGSRNVYVADYGNSAVKEISAVGGSIPASPTIETLGGGFSDPEGVAVDGSGNVYVADTFHSEVKEILAAGTDFGKVNLGSTSTVIPLQFAFVTAGTGVSSAVLTQGATGLDFADAGTGSCTTNGTSHTYSAGDSCTIDATFTPRYPGLRLGAVLILNPENGDVLATAPVYGIGVGPEIGFASGAQTVLGRDLGQSIGVAVDGAGDVFIGDSGNNRLVELPVGGGPEATLASGLDNPGEIAVDGAGDVFIADANNSRVLEVPADGGPQTAVGSGLAAPYGVAVDGAGDVFISDFDNNNVVEVPASGNPQITVVTGLNQPKGIAVDGAGDIFIANDGGGNILEARAGGGAPVVVASGFVEPQEVAVDAAGDMFVADEDNSSLIEVPGGGGAQILLGNNGFNGPEGVAVDGAGNLFVADTFNNRVVELPFSQPPSVVFSSSGVTQTVTLENIGNLPVALPGIEQKTNPAISDSSFVLNTTGATACAVVTASAATPGALTPGFTCALPITFSPTNGGTQSGALVLTDNSLNASPTVFTSQTIPLSGTASANLPAITWGTPAAIFFGTALSATQLNATANVAGTFSYNPAAGTQLGAGTHTLSVNFTPTNTTSFTTASTTVTLTVNKAVPAIVWATPAAITYGTVLSATQLDATSPVAGKFVYTPPAGTGFPVGSQTLSVTFTPTDTTDYVTATASVTLTVNKALPAINWATPAAIAYGTPLSASQLNATAAAAGTFSYSPVSGTVLTAGPHTLSVTFTPADTADFTTAKATRVLTVDKAVLTVFPHNLSKVYGAPIPTLTYALLGFVNGDTQATATTGAPGLTTTATSKSAAGIYPITASQGTLAAANYSFKFLPESLTVTKAALTVFPHNLSMVYGAPIPTLTYALLGFVNGDTQATATTGAPSITTTATPKSAVGSYPIVSSAGSLAAANYTFKFLTESLTITKATLTVAAYNYTRVFDTALPATFDYSISGFRNGDSAATAVRGAPIITTTAVKGSPVGTYPITPAIGTLAAANYNFTFKNGTLTITP